MLTAGAVLAGRYRLTRLLGEGGMGTVWAAHNESIERDVAIKVMLPALASDESLLQRFFNEAKVAGRIRHPGIVDVLDLGKADDGSPFIVMEMLDGQPLDAWLADVPRPPLQTALRVVRDVASTISLAHQKGIVHRDLKPANLFLHRSGNGTVVKVLDFGISKIVGKDGPMNTTRTGQVLGSPSYMSPEQASGKGQVDARTDVWALGVILFEMLSGRLPHEDENYNALILSIVTSDAPHLATVAPEVPRPIAALVARCLARDRDARVASAAELAAEIDALLRASSSDARGSLSLAMGLPLGIAATAHARTEPAVIAGATPMGARHDGRTLGATSSPLGHAAGRGGHRPPLLAVGILGGLAATALAFAVVVALGGPARPDVAPSAVSVDSVPPSPAVPEVLPATPAEPPRSEPSVAPSGSAPSAPSASSVAAGPSAPAPVPKAARGPAPRSPTRPRAPAPPSSRTGTGKKAWNSFD